MERKCKNCISFWPLSHYSDGNIGVCHQGVDVKIQNRENECDCGSFIEMPKIPRLKSRIENRLYPWIRERDDMFRRSMEIVNHICQLFNQGEFRVFDATKSATDMKSIVFMGKDVSTSIANIWTYHCPWDEEVEHFIAITSDGKFVTNTFDNSVQPSRFITECYDIEENFDTCNDIINRIMSNCKFKANISSMPEELEQNKCIYNKDEL